MAGTAQKIFSAGVAAVLVCMAGCATVRRPPEPPQPAAVKEPGVYHTVIRGETLWRISRMYGSEVDRIAAANNIQDARQLEVGQRLFIPGGEKRAVSFAGGSQAEDFMWPVTGTVIGGFGRSDRGTANKGITISPGNDRAVKASRSGTVVFYNDNFLDLGNTIVLDHGDGFFTVYGKVTDVSVKPGDHAPQGARIAQAGTAGHPSMYFEIRKGAISKNPNFYLSR
ncbi:MAG: M23 family metallopeptidase [Candidatus Omnitrophota bacterium]